MRAIPLNHLLLSCCSLALFGNCCSWVGMTKDILGTCGIPLCVGYKGREIYVFKNKSIPEKDE